VAQYLLSRPVAPVSVVCGSSSYLLFVALVSVVRGSSICRSSLVAPVSCSILVAVVPVAPVAVVPVSVACGSTPLSSICCRVVVAPVVSPVVRGRLWLHSSLQYLSSSLFVVVAVVRSWRMICCLMSRHEYLLVVK